MITLYYLTLRYLSCVKCVHCSNIMYNSRSQYHTVPYLVRAPKIIEFSGTTPFWKLAHVEESSKNIEESHAKQTWNNIYERHIRVDLNNEMDTRNPGK